MKGNTPIEVMKAIVENGGPVESWVAYGVTSWSEIRCKIYGVLLEEECPYITSAGRVMYASLTNPNPQYKPIPTEWTNDWAEWRAVDQSGDLCEFQWQPGLSCDGWISEGYMFNYVSKGHDPTNWQDSLEQRPNKQRPMTSLEAYEFLAEGHEGKPRVWRKTSGFDNRWFTAASWLFHYLPEFSLFANLSDRDGDTLIWREFPQVKEDKA